MIIKNIEFNDKKDKFVIETDTKESFLLSYNDFERYKIHNEMTIDDELYTHLLNISKFTEAFEISLNFLSYKLRTEKEIITKLKSKKFSIEIIDEVITKLKNLDLLDDYNYAKIFINDKINLTNYSKRRIINDLYQKGIDKRIYEDYLEDVFGYNMELDKATQIVETKINIWKEKHEGYDLKNKIVTFLLQKGFSYDVAKQVSGMY
ncbi:regulatory protein RecX [Finegoldia magna]|uniref:regulatory protein RecX n=1 Tax=Finegoldia magna TaxID=1260 RepID=UPI000B918001|nr:RecX family transcriptional regulator [Finegoldia magna]MDU1010042.1 RecX family transcriptional regulator [Finegoldia magna]MDU1087788.1 RecX family transcriptional regulator [Finegoldia magna]MDU2132002.1 RecX family transcriptional regulator [Finegoldia magna]MDU4277295.1 RecX family transcriptional regulator [Finegoldia magna]MDU5069538.1 RecX family transcriptional regulator [Finegoldia magna]